MNLVREDKSAGDVSHWDRYWGIAISAVLHLAAVMWALTGMSQAQQGKSVSGTSSGTLLLRILGDDEFRQPLVALPPVKPVSVVVAEPEPESVTNPTLLPIHAITDVAISEALMPGQPSLVSSVAAAQPHGGDAAGQVDTPMDVPLESTYYDPREQAYLMALRAAIQSKWSRRSGRCSVTIQQTIGGQVIGAVSKSCVLSESDRRALEEAVLAAQPLPYAGFERVFQEQVTVKMEE